MIGKDKTPLEALMGAELDDEIVFAVRCKRSKISITSDRRLYCGAENIVSAEVIRPLRAGDKVRHKEAPRGDYKARTVRVAMELEGRRVIGFVPFSNIDDSAETHFGIGDTGANLKLNWADLYERVEE